MIMVSYFFTQKFFMFPLPVKPNVILNSCKISMYSIALLLLFVIPMGGCGYSSKSLLRSNVRSVYIPIFDNDTFRRGFEFDLTKAIRDQILMRTPLNIVNKDEADSVLFGKITNVYENVLIEDTRDNIVESKVTIGLEIRWVDKRTGRVIVERKNIHAPAEFIVRRNETLTSASNEAFVRVARSVVEAMQEDW
ncbi:MAG: LptE family protein [Candidatus Jettenia caeni]|nr:LptE family protein [Candidatus Jettenia caeni]